MNRTPGDTLKAFRHEHGLSRRELASKLDVTRMTVWRWEEGERNIDEEKLPRVVEFTKIPATIWRPDLAKLMATAVGS